MVGIRLLGIGLIVTGLILLIFFLNDFALVIRWKSLPNLNGILLWLLLPSIVHLILGIGILRLRVWARRLLYLVLPTGLLLSPFLIFLYSMRLYPNYFLGSVLMYAGYLYWVIAPASLIYFLFPKVKKHFRGK